MEGALKEGWLMYTVHWLLEVLCQRRTWSYLVETKGGSFPVTEGSMVSSSSELLLGYPEEAGSVVEMYEKKGIFLFDLWLDRQMEKDETKELGAVGPEGFRRQAKP